MRAGLRLAVRATIAAIVAVGAYGAFSRPLHAAAGAILVPHRIVHQVGLDCESAATESLLSTLGSGLTQGQIQAALPVDLRPAQLDGHGNVVHWGDPWTDFVGNVHGSEPAFTGYGVYAPAMAATIGSLGVHVVAEQGVDPWTLYAAVAAGKPAVVWVIAGLWAPAPRTWTAWDGASVVYDVGEHAETLVGVDPGAGTVTLMNPEDGRDEVASMGRFEASFAVLGRQAIVPDPSFPGAVVRATSPFVGVASTPDGRGYWLARADGGVEAFGDAPRVGEWFPARLNRPIVGIAATRDGGGYWLVASDGGVFPYGDAAGYGSTGGIRLNQPVVGIAGTADSRGYWIVCADGGIFPFGDAVGHGSTGAIHLNRPIVGMAPARDGGGYLLVASDGGVFPFGDATGRGSTGGVALAMPVVGMAPAPGSQGYWLVAADGGVFPFGVPGFGSTGGIRLAAPMAAMAATPDGRGYWLVGSDGGVFPFGDAAGYGSGA